MSGLTVRPCDSNNYGVTATKDGVKSDKRWRIWIVSKKLVIIRCKPIDAVASRVCIDESILKCAQLRPNVECSNPEVDVVTEVFDKAKAIISDPPPAIVSP